MELWFDTTDAKAVEKVANLGILTGVTTNTKLIQEAKRPLEEILTKLLDAQEGPVAVQVQGTTTPEMIRHAKELHSFSSRIMAKVPINALGLEVLKALENEEVLTLATANHSIQDAFLSFKIGADYAAFFIGSMEEGSLSSKEEIAKAISMKDSFAFPTKIMAASIRSLSHLQIALSLNVSAVTISPNLFFEL